MRPRSGPRPATSAAGARGRPPRSTRAPARRESSGSGSRRARRDSIPSRRRPGSRPGARLSRSRPPRKASSIRNEQPATSAPARSTSSHSALAVPPVASRSSCTSTRAPAGKASACTSRTSVPYSSSYSTATRPARQLARLAAQHEAQAGRGRGRAAQHEAARLGGDDVGGVHVGGVPDHAVHCGPQPVGVGEHGRHVLEHDPRLGEVGDVADQLRDPLCAGAHFAILRRSRISSRCLR